MTEPTPDSRKREKIENRIAAALRLAEDPGATEAERNQALDTVARLTEQYKINAAHIDPNSGQYTREDIVTHTFTVPGSYGLTGTRHHGLYTLVEAMGAGAYIVKEQRETGRSRRNGRPTRYRTHMTGLTVHATESTMHVLKVLVPSLFLQEARACDAYIRQVKETDPWMVQALDVRASLRTQKVNVSTVSNLIDAELRRRRQSFSLAFFVEAAERVKQKRADAVQEAGRGYDLVVIDTEARIKASMEDLGLSERKIRSDRKFSADGWEAGTAAGQQAMVGQTELYGGRLEIEG